MSTNCSLTRKFLSILYGRQNVCIRGSSDSSQRNVCLLSKYFLPAAFFENPARATLINKNNKSYWVRFQLLMAKKIAILKLNRKNFTHTLFELCVNTPNNTLFEKINKNVHSDWLELRYRHKTPNAPPKPKVDLTSLVQ